MSDAKRYLGDGVYVAMDESRDMLVLTTENGINVSNVIYMERHVVEAFLAYVREKPWCDHEWQEQPGEPPVDTCSRCGATRR